MSESQGAFTTTTEPQVTETAQAESKPAVKQDDFTDRFARLAALDRAQRQRDAEIKSRMKELETREMSVKEKLELADMLDKDPLSVLKKKGVDIHELYLKGMGEADIEADPIRKELAELKAWKEQFEGKLNEEKTLAQRKQEEELQQKRTGYINHLSEFIKANEEKYPVLAEFEDASEKVYELMSTVYEQSGKTITPEEASAHLQEHLVETYKKVLNKKGVSDLLKIKFLDSDTKQDTLESIFNKPESGNTIDNTFKAASSEPQALSTEQERVQAAIKLAEKLFKNGQGI